MYFNIFNYIVDEYNNTYHRTTKMKSTDVKNYSFAKYYEEYNEKYHQFKVNDHVRVSKSKNIFAKGYAPNWSEKIFVAKKKINSTVP